MAGSGAEHDDWGKKNPHIPGSENPEGEDFGVGSEGAATHK